MRLLSNHIFITKKRSIISIVLFPVILSTFLLSGDILQKNEISTDFVEVLNSFSTPYTEYGCGGFSRNKKNSYVRSLEDSLYGAFVLQYRNPQTNNFEQIRMDEGRYIELLMRWNENNTDYTQTLFTMDGLHEIEDHSLGDAEIALSKDIIEKLPHSNVELRLFSQTEKVDSLLNLTIPVTYKYSFEKDFGLTKEVASNTTPYPIAIIGYNSIIRSIINTKGNYRLFSFYNIQEEIYGCNEKNNIKVIDIVDQHYQLVGQETSLFSVNLLAIFSIYLFSAFLIFDYFDYLIYLQRSKLTGKRLFWFHFKVQSNHYFQSLILPFFISILFVLLDHFFSNNVLFFFNPYSFSILVFWIYTLVLWILSTIFTYYFYTLTKGLIEK